MADLNPWILILAGLVLLFLGGEALVRGAARLALRLGLTPLVVGLTVVAFGTSSPELFVSVNAAREGSGDIAVGNIIGSNIGNIGLILALCALVHPLRVAMQVLRFDVPVMLGVCALFFVFLLNDRLGRAEGLLLISLLVAYCVVVVRLARKERAAEVQQEFAESMPPLKTGVWLDIVFIVAGLALLAGGSRLLIDGATTIARAIGMSEAVIGLTIVSLGTSLPELSASVVAAFKRVGDIAVGNVVGSNIFNILCIGGLSSTILPLQAAGIQWTDYAVMLGFCAMLLPLMKSGFVIKRWEGALLALCYIAYVTWLISFASGS